MFNIQFHFVYPWLLLLLIPAFALTFFPYFRLSKRYRRTRNRIISIILHIFVSVFSILALSGLTITYDTYNDENQIILLVDVSSSEERVEKERDKFIQTFLRDAAFDNFQVGIVTFGYDQEYAVPLTRDLDTVFAAYEMAVSPDVGATNYADALTYTKDLFNNPQTAKIVLVTDGKETDKDAKNVIRSIVAQGIKVDTVYIGSNYDGTDIQVSAIELPDYHVNVEEECQISVTVQATGDMEKVSIKLYDNGKCHADNGIMEMNLFEGPQTITFTHVFEDVGLHELKFSVEDKNGVEINNSYATDYLLEMYNKILILEREDEYSNALIDLLNNSEEGSENNTKKYQITVKNVYTSTDLPKSVEEMRAYDQIILNNISDADIKQKKLNQISNGNIPEGFDLMLEEYVNVYGGGLFTVGGKDQSGEANAYNRKDLYNTVYQRMLPVQAIDYTPPLGVIVIIDRSSSMQGQLEFAKAGAAECLLALNDRDYFGIMTLDSYNETILPLTPRTQEAKIRAALNSLETTSGGTVFSGAINRAGIELRGLDAVDRRHVIIVSDGEVGGDEGYLDMVRQFHEEDGITFSFVGVNIKAGAEKNMRYLAETLGGGNFYKAENSGLMDAMYDDLTTGPIAEINMEEFKPIMYKAISPLFKNVDSDATELMRRMTVKLGGFVGVKVRETAELILTGDFEVPLYAQWKYGQGMVGSFMCDLAKSDWSSEFMDNPNGRNFITNVVNNLMPTKDIGKKDITIRLTEDNYTNQMNIYTSLGEGEYIRAEMVNISKPNSQTISLNEVTLGDARALREMPYYVTSGLGVENYYTRCNFVIRQSGTYQITLRKFNAQNQQIGEDIVTYKTFSYSEEYDVFEENTEQQTALLQTIADLGNGKMVQDTENPHEVFADFVIFVWHLFDPRFFFMIASIVLFLTDIAVRKFKFKWIHEIIRERKEKNRLNQGKR